LQTSLEVVYGEMTPLRVSWEGEMDLPLSGTLRFNKRLDFSLLNVDEFKPVLGDGLTGFQVVSNDLRDHPLCNCPDVIGVSLNLSFQPVLSPSPDGTSAASLAPPPSVLLAQSTSPIPSV
jgi:hypothetical protein